MSATGSQLDTLLNIVILFQWQVPGLCKSRAGSALCTLSKTGSFTYVYEIMCHSLVFTWILLLDEGQRPPSF